MVWAHLEVRTAQRTLTRARTAVSRSTPSTCSTAFSPPSCQAPRAPPGGSARRRRAAVAGGARLVGGAAARVRRAGAAGARPADDRAADEFWGAPAPTPRSTSTRSAAARRARSSRPSPDATCRSGSLPARTPRRSAPRSSVCSVTPSDRRRTVTGQYTRHGAPIPGPSRSRSRGARSPCLRPRTRPDPDGRHDPGPRGLHAARHPSDPVRLRPPNDNFHAPDESFAIASLELGRRAARALYEDLAGLR